MSPLDWFRAVFASLRQRRWREAIILYLALNKPCRNFLLDKLNDLIFEQYEWIMHPKEFIIRGIRFKTIDLGGPQIAPRVWKDYHPKVDAVVYIVNAAYREHLAETRNELDALLSDEALAKVPFLVLGEMDDSPHAPSEGELLNYLGLTNLTTGKGRVSLEPTVRPPSRGFHVQYPPPEGV